MFTQITYIFKQKEYITYKSKKRSTTRSYMIDYKNEELGEQYYNPIRQEPTHIPKDATSICAPLLSLRSPKTYRSHPLYGRCFRTYS